jgi:tetratricopeptide (TPR) repeat protein
LKAASQRTDARSQAASLWIYNPWLDLIVGCGAWSAPLLLLAYFSVASNTLRWSVVFYVLALFFNYPHYMATIYRAYHREEDFNRYRIFTVHITFLVLLTAVLTHFWPGALPLIFTIYLTGSPWHYSGQNYGLFMMFARRAGAQPSRAERNAIYAAFLLSYAILFVNFHTGPSQDPLFISLNLPTGLSSTLQLVLAVAFVGCSAFGLSRLLGQVGWRECVPSLTLFATQFVWFLLPTVLALGEKLRVPQSRYSTGVLAVMHSAQYLWITSYYARREAVAGGKQSWRPWAYFVVLITGGIALFVPGPWIASHVFHFDFTRSFLIFTALVNLHHFILDGAIWKLREGRIASLLIQSRSSVSEAASHAGSRFLGAFRWMASAAPAARGLRVAAALLLLTWGTVDQVRYYLALRSDSLPDLERAARLTAMDSSLQMKLARQALDHGQKEEAVTAMQQAMAADPSNPTPRNFYLQFLTSERRYDEAYSLTQAMIVRWPKDAQLLLNHGILADELGKREEAVASWTRALTIDPHLAEAHLYLAAQLDGEGKMDQAIPHYKRYLEIVARQGSDHRPAPEQVVAAALKLADCQQRLEQSSDAVQTFDLARKLAAETKQAKFESLASTNEAALKVRAGRSREAGELYQRAILLDDSLSDFQSEAADLEQYAEFLHANLSQTTFSYAALLRAQTLRGGKAPAPAEVVRLRAELEKQLGPQAAALRRESDRTLKLALSPAILR